MISPRDPNVCPFCGKSIYAEWDLSKVILSNGTAALAHDACVKGSDPVASDATRNQIYGQQDTTLMRQTQADINTRVAAERAAKERAIAVPIDQTAACPRCTMGVITKDSQWLDGRRICDACFMKATEGVTAMGQKAQAMDYDIGKVRISPKTIDYTITPKRFTLDIPVEALDALTPDAHTRMLAMLNNWITENKPPVVVAEKKP